MWFLGHDLDLYSLCEPRVVFISKFFLAIHLEEVSLGFVSIVCVHVSKFFLGTVPKGLSLYYSSNPDFPRSVS